MLKKKKRTITRKKKKGGKSKKRKNKTKNISKLFYIYIIMKTKNTCSICLENVTFPANKFFNL